MKILYSLLLGAWITSTNSNFLLAQDENRLKATNQVIGCRLQMPLQRQEMEDRRWKMEVEAQGCSFQNIEGRVMNENEYKDVDNQSSFLANDSVPISHLPSSSYYLGITPKLMMNPETTRDLGGILKFSRNPFKDFMNLSRNPLFPSKASSEREILNAAQVSPIEEGSSISDVIENNSKNNKNSDLTNNENIEKYFTDIKEKILVLTEQIEAAKQASKEQLGGENSYLWDRIATKLEQARDSWHKVNRLLSELAYFDEVQGVDGAQNLSVQTSSMVRAPERRSNSLKEVEYQVVGRPRDRLLQVEAWNSQYFQGRPRDRLLQVEAWNSQYFQGRPRDRLRRIKFEQPERQAERERASQFGKESSELVEQGSIERVTLWRKAAEESEAAAEGIRQAVQAYISGQKKSAEQLEKETWSAYYLSDAATWSLKSEEALEKTNQMRGESEDFWRDLSEQYHIAADYEKKASEAHKANKKDERNSCCWVGRYLHSSAERKLKAMEAREAGKEELAVGYQDASEVFQQAAEQRKKAIAVYTLGKESEGHSWAWSADSLQKKADYLVKACEAHEANKATLAFGYREAAITSGRAADQWKLSAETKAAGKTNEGNCWGWVGDSLQAGADYQAKVCEAEEAGKKILGAGYGEVVAILKHAADQYKQSALTSAAGKQNESDSWYLVGKSLQAMADYQAKASEAEETGKLTLATGYREAAATFERAASQRKLAAETKAAGKESEGNSWGWVGRSLQAKADYQVKASEAEEAGKTILAFGYREAVTILGRAADQWKLSAETKAAGKESEGISWGKEGESLQKKADYQAKASEAEEAGKLILATGYREAVTISGYAAEQYKLSAEAKAKGKEELSIIRNIEGQSFQSQADYQVKACEAEEAGKTNLCIGYKESVTILEGAIKQFKEAAEAHMLEKISEGTRYYYLGTFFQTKANYQVKASEVGESTKTILATGYREAAITLQYAIDQFQKGIQAEAVGKEDESKGWYGASASLQAQADYQAKASEAQENGKEALAAGYREVALISEKAAELREQEAQKKALGKIDEGVNYGVEGECLQLQADYNIKAIEAEEAGKVILATGYREAAETSQRAAGIKHQAGEAIASGKEYVGNSLSWVGQSLKLKAEYQAKIIIAREAGKEVLAVRYREVVETSQKASEYYQQAADIFALEKINEGYNDYLVGEYLRSKAEYQAEVAEKAEEESEKSVIKKTDKIISSLIRGNGNFNSMKSKALFVYCEKWLAEGGPINISDYVINVLHTLKKSADYKLIRSYEEYRNNVWEAHKLGDDFLAFSLIQVVEDIQQAIEDSIQQAKASENNNSKLSDAWKNVVQVGQKLAECRDRYIQISVRAQSHEIVSGWKKIVETSEFIVDYHRKAAEACALNNEQDYNRFNNAGDSMIESVTKLEEAVTAFGKSLSLSNEPELAEAWKKVAEEYQRSAEFDEKVAEEELQGNKEEVARLTAAAKASQETAKALENEAKASEKK